VRPSRAILFWTAVIAALLIIEVLEITAGFRLPLSQVVANPYTFVFALVFTTIVALIGAIFIGIYISARLLSPRGFTPFEEEMLRMRAEVQEIREDLGELARRLQADPAGPSPSGADDPPPSRRST
jgi:hypothetical protein